MYQPRRLGWWIATLRMTDDQPVVSLKYHHNDAEYVFVLDIAANGDWAVYHDDPVGTLVVCGAEKVDDGCFVLLDHFAVLNTARALCKQAVVGV